MKVVYLASVALAVLFTPSAEAIQIQKEHTH
jgi:hypothetical protein